MFKCGKKTKSQIQNLDYAPTLQLEKCLTQVSFFFHIMFTNALVVFTIHQPHLQRCKTNPDETTFLVDALRLGQMFTLSQLKTDWMNNISFNVKSIF